MYIYIFFFLRLDDILAVECFKKIFAVSDGGILSRECRVCKGICAFEDERVERFSFFFFRCVRVFVSSFHTNKAKGIYSNNVIVVVFDQFDNSASKLSAKFSRNQRKHPQLH